MAKYVYPAIFSPEEDGRYSVSFPDFESCYTCGDDLADAMMMAADALAFTLYDCERGKAPIPCPSLRNEIHLDSERDFINYIACDTLQYAKMHNNRAVKKTLTIPEWLNEAAVIQNVNFSQLLQESLIQKLGL